MNFRNFAPTFLLNSCSRVRKCLASATDSFNFFTVFIIESVSLNTESDNLLLNSSRLSGPCSELAAASFRECLALKKGVLNSYLFLFKMKCCYHRLDLWICLLLLCKLDQSFFRLYQLECWNRSFEYQWKLILTFCCDLNFIILKSIFIFFDFDFKMTIYWQSCCFENSLNANIWNISKKNCMHFLSDCNFNTLI